MQAFSLSQNKLIDVPDNGVASNGPNLQPAPTVTSPTTNVGGVTEDLVKKYMIYDWQRGGKNLSETKTLYEMLFPQSKTNLDAPLSVNEAMSLNVPYGTTKKQAAQKGITPSAKNSAQGEMMRMTGIDVIGDIEKSDLSRVGSREAAKVKALSAFPGELGKMFLGEKDQDLVGLNSSFELLKQTAVAYLQGKRASDFDMKMANQYTASIMDSKSSIKTKMEKLNKLLGRYATTPGVTEGADLESLYNQFGGGQ